MAARCSETDVAKRVKRLVHEANMKYCSVADWKEWEKRFGRPSAWTDGHRPHEWGEHVMEGLRRWYDEGNIDNAYLKGYDFAMFIKPAESLSKTTVQHEVEQKDMGSCFVNFGLNLF